MIYAKGKFKSEPLFLLFIKAWPKGKTGCCADDAVQSTFTHFIMQHTNLNPYFPSVHHMAHGRWAHIDFRVHIHEKFKEHRIPLQTLQFSFYLMPNKPKPISVLKTQAERVNLLCVFRAKEREMS
jgi:hypothetical protein